MSRFAYSIFCDDIRQEMQGKLSLIGVYDTQVLVPEFPANIMRMCVLITAMTPISKPFSEICFIGKFGDRELFQLNIDKDQLREADEASPKDPDAIFQKIQTVAFVNPLFLEQPGDIVIEVVADGEHIECPGLQARKMPA